jgi:hypothetical protein
MAKKSPKDVAEMANETKTKEYPAMPDLSEFEQVSSVIWRPQEGEYVYGYFVRSEPLPEEYKKDNMEGDVMIHFVHSPEQDALISFVGGKMCDQFIKAAQAKPNDLLYVRFLGRGETNKGNPVNNFDIRIKRV